MSVHNIMRVTFLKRLESSQAALSLSLTKYLQRLEKFEKYLQEGHIANIKDINQIEKEFGEDSSSWSDEDVRDILDIELIPANVDKYKIEQMKRDIQRDKRIISTIQECCAVLDNHDDKLTSLVELIKNLRKNKKAGEKILLFSYFTDTINYLEKRLPGLIDDEEFASKSAFLSGANRALLEDTVKRFSPISTNSGVEKSEGIDFLFATDVLSEGQNLQDCGNLINYDLHWNPVRMIQRNGRINRLGSAYESVYIYNMHPETVLDSYLKLVKRLERKIDAIKFTIGTDQSVLGEEENPIEFLDGFEEDESLREVLDMYNDPDGSSVMDKFDDDDQLLSEDEFVIELRRFLATASEEQIKRVKGIPLGKWGHLPGDTKMVERRILSLTETSGYVEATGKDFTSHFFIEADAESGYMVDAVDIIEALGYIKCDDSIVKSKADNFDYNRNLVKKLVEAASREEARDGHSAVRLTPTKIKVLDNLALALPGLSISLVLKNISTKQQLRKTEQLFMAANRELKSFGQLLPNTLELFTALHKELIEARPEERTIEAVEAVLFYVP